MFTLKRPIDPTVTADEDDVFRTKSALRRLGFYRSPVDTIPEMDLIDAVARFQTSRGLARTGVIKPDGAEDRPRSGPGGRQIERRR